MVRLVKGSLVPWLPATTTNVEGNSHRSRRRYESFLVRLPLPVPLADPAQLIEDRQVLAALRRLSLPEQQVALLCSLEGWPEREAAEALRIPPGTLKSRLHRAKKKLAARMDPPSGLEPRAEAPHGI